MSNQAIKDLCDKIEAVLQGHRHPECVAALLALAAKGLDEGKAPMVVRRELAKQFTETVLGDGANE